MMMQKKLVKARSIHESDEKYPKDVLHMYAQNELTMKSNEAVLIDLPRELYTEKANDKIPK